MKTLCTTLLVIIAGTLTHAQTSGDTFQFCDPDGNIYPNGSNIICNQTSVDPDDGTVSVTAPLYIKNITDQGGYVGITCQYQNMPGGTFKICFPYCMITTDASATIVTDAGGANLLGYPLEKKNGAKDVGTSWTDITSYGSFSVTYQINVYQKIDAAAGATPDNFRKTADGSTITVNYLYDDPDGIKMPENSVTGTSVYSLNGLRISTLMPGVRIEVGDNRKARKVLVR